jgi:hypothetical protein
MKKAQLGFAVGSLESKKKKTGSLGKAAASVSVNKANVAAMKSLKKTHKKAINLAKKK